MQVTPEFSVRLMDESFQKENDTIQQIQDRMVQYFLGRSGKLAQDGISGLPVLHSNEFNLALNELSGRITIWTAVWNITWPTP